MPTIPQPPDPRQQQYEALLDDVLHEVHILTTPPRDGDPPPDDSAVHELLQRLRDEFGPEVPR